MAPMIDWGSIVLVSAALVGSLIGLIYFGLSMTGNSPTNPRQDTDNQ
jgi:hypothetical protein